MALEGLKETWDLNSIFEGGSRSEEFQQYIQELKKHLSAFQHAVEAFTAPTHADESRELINLIDRFERSAIMIRQAGAFVGCLQAQNTHDQKANEWRARINQLSSDFKSALVTLDDTLARIDERVWEELPQKPELQDLTYVLNERRDRVKEKLSASEERLIEGLAVDGYHAWGDLYNAAVGRMKIPFEDKELSVGQAENMMAHPDRRIRRQVFKELNEAWKGEEELFGDTLNHLAGFRTEIYKARGWKSALEEPLAINRMKKETLDVMWQVITDHKKAFCRIPESKGVSFRA